VSFSNLIFVFSGLLFTFTALSQHWPFICLISVVYIPGGMNPTFDLFKIDNKKSKGQKNEGLAAEDTFLPTCCTVHLKLR